MCVSVAAWLTTRATNHRKHNNFLNSLYNVKGHRPKALIDDHSLKLMEYPDNCHLKISLADPGGTARAPPNGIQFFCFCQKAPMSEVGAPQWRGTPQQEILDPPLNIVTVCTQKVQNFLRIYRKPISVCFVRVYNISN